MSFTLTPLAGTQTLVEGTDVRGNFGQMVVDNSQWESIKRRTEHVSAVAEVDAAIEAFLAPIQEAVDKANAKLAAPKLDAMLYVVEREGTEHVAGQSEIVTRLSTDSVILRAIEEGKTDRLIWLNDQLVLTAEAVAPAPEVEVPGFEPEG